MKSVLCVLLCLIFISCSDKLAKERINLATTFIEHPDKYDSILDSSSFNCDQTKSKHIFSRNFLDNIKMKKYKLWDDEIRYVETGEIINNNYFLKKIDTCHGIVFLNENTNRDFISIIFILKNNIWCIEATANINYLDFHIDY